MALPPGITREDWDATKAEALAVLTERASRRLGQTITYSELANQIGPLAFGPHDNNFHELLGELSEDENAVGRGMISVLVVYKDPNKMKPGPGFFKLARKLDHKGDDDEIWSVEMGRVLEIHRR